MLLVGVSSFFDLPLFDFDFERVRKVFVLLLTQNKTYLGTVGLALSQYTNKHYNYTN